MSISVKSHYFSAPRSGPRLVVFGAVHGDEHCGTKACESTMERIRTGQIDLTYGSVCFVPICNPAAYVVNSRFLDENLNRIFRRSVAPCTREAVFANELCDVLDRGADVLLDIHSTSTHGPTSVFVDYPSAEGERLAQALGVEYILLDWPVVYANSPNNEAALGTTDYARERGILGVTVECGQHADPAAVNVAECVILRTLSHMGMANVPAGSFPAPSRVRLRTVEWKHDVGDKLAGPWRHLDQVSEGTVIAQRANGACIRATAECVVLFPGHTARVGAEWFYIGTIE